MKEKSQFKYTTKVKSVPHIDTEKVKEYPFVARFMQHFSNDHPVETDSILAHIKEHSSMSNLSEPELLSKEEEIFSLSHCALNDLPLEREVAMIKLMEMRHIPNERIQFLTTQALEYLFSIPLTFTEEDEQKEYKQSE